MLGLTTLTIAAGLFIVAQPIAHADANTETKADVTVQSGGITITPLAKIDFGTVTKDGADHTQSDQSSSQIVVNDNRGTTDTGWYLTANLEDTGSGKTGLDGMTLHIGTKRPDGSTEKGTFTEEDLTTDAANIIALGKDDIDLAETVTTANLNATLEVPKIIPANTYSGTIVWNAVDGAPM